MGAESAGFAAAAPPREVGRGRQRWCRRPIRAHGAFARKFKTHNFNALWGARMGNSAENDATYQLCKVSRIPLYIFVHIETCSVREVPLLDLNARVNRRAGEPTSIFQVLLLSCGERGALTNQDRDRADASPRELTRADASGCEQGWAESPRMRRVWLLCKMAALHLATLDVYC